MFLILNWVDRFVEIVDDMYFGIVNGLICLGELFLLMIWWVVYIVLVDGLLDFVIRLVCMFDMVFLVRFVFLIVWFIVI